MRELCQIASDWRGHVPDGGTMAELKVDGWRCLYMPGIDGKYRLWSRNGMPLEGAAHIEHLLEAIAAQFDQRMMFDGEIQVDETLAATKAWFETGWRKGGDNGVLHLFDAIPVSDWKSGRCDRPLIERKASLKAAFESAALDDWTWREGSKGADESGCVQILEDTWLFDRVDVEDEVRRQWARNLEGIMLKDAMSPYIRERNTAWQKVKAENVAKWMAKS